MKQTGQEGDTNEEHQEILQDDLVFVMSALFLLIELFFFMNREMC